MNILLPICSLQSHFAFDYSYRKAALEIINVVVVISFFPCKKKLKGMHARCSIADGAFFFCRNLAVNVLSVDIKF